MKLFVGKKILHVNECASFPGGKKLMMFIGVSRNHRKKSADQ